MMAFPLQIAWDNSYAAQLGEFYVSCLPAAAPEPTLLQLNRRLADELGWDVAAIDPGAAARLFSGVELPAGTQPLAQAYAGHQFGGFAPQLGDGRALLLGEVIDRHGRRRDIGLKGSGPTPFSRGGDGKAAIGPVLREYLIGEAMHACGIPTTRALAAVATGEQVMRERPLPGAVLTRVAASHVRVGTFEFFAARDQQDRVRRLADYVIARHDPELVADGDRYLRLLASVAERQASLVAGWMLLGFIHGVMNTDNMAVSGETIDYGPCAFMEAFDPQAVFSSIDHGGRYAYEKQPAVARWNLARFAETLLPLFDAEAPADAVGKATEVIEQFMPRYEAHWLAGARRKLGLAAESRDDEADTRLVQDWMTLLARHQVDWTLAWRKLADAAEGSPESVVSLFGPSPEVPAWLARWQQRWDAAGPVVADRLRRVNPIYIPRNHLVEESLAAAGDGDLAPLERLLAAVSRPYDERSELAEYAEPAPLEFTSRYRTFCGT